MSDTERGQIIELMLAAIDLAALAKENDCEYTVPLFALARLETAAKNMAKALAPLSSLRRLREEPGAAAGGQAEERSGE